MPGPPKSGQDPEQNLTESVNVIDRRTAELQSRMDDMMVALASIAGLDGVAVGVAQVAELLQPLRGLIPPTVALPLPDETAEAVVSMRVALGHEPSREPAVDRLPIVDLPVGFIGEPHRPGFQQQEAYDYFARALAGGDVVFVTTSEEREQIS